jgi:glycosyltransferase involved in cell wall biosynthesis
MSTLSLTRITDALTIIFTLYKGLNAALRAAEDGNVVHTVALWALPSGFWARMLKVRKGVPYSVWMLGSDVWSLGRIPVVRQILAAVMRAADHRFADGIELAAASQNICGLPVEFLPSTRDLARKRDAALAVSPPYRLLFIGRWHPNKGPDLLLQALAQLDESDWSMISAVGIFGGGALDAVVRGSAEALVRAGRPIHVGGFLSKADAEREIIKADYLIIPSRIESIPVIFSDAVKLRCPVICTPVGDLRNIVPEWKVGFCAAEISSSGLVDTIRRALRTPPAGFDLMLNAAAERFSLQSAVCPHLLRLANKLPKDACAA